MCESLIVFTRALCKGELDPAGWAGIALVKSKTFQVRVFLESLSSLQSEPASDTRFCSGRGTQLLLRRVLPQLRLRLLLHRSCNSHGCLVSHLAFL